MSRNFAMNASDTLIRAKLTTNPVETEEVDSPARRGYSGHSRRTRQRRFRSWCAHIHLVRGIEERTRYRCWFEDVRVRRLRYADRSVHMD